MLDQPHHLHLDGPGRVPAAPRTPIGAEAVSVNPQRRGRRRMYEEEEMMASLHTREHLMVVGRMSNGQPRSYRLSRPQSREAAYRRLAVAILGLDVSTLTAVLQ